MWRWHGRRASSSRGLAGQALSEIAGPDLDPRFLPAPVLGGLLDHAAAAAPACGVTFVDADGASVRRTYPEVLAEAEALLASLAAAGVGRGDRLVFILPDPRAFLTAFWACQLGGMVPVPLPLPATLAEGSEPLAMLAEVSARLGGPRILVAARDRAMLADAFAGAGLDAARMLDLDAIPPGTGLRERARLEPGDLAMLAFTSGSTGRPKGVRVTQAMMTRRAAGMCQAFALGRDDAAMNWMPLDHVASIIMGHLWAVAAGAEQMQVATAHVLGDILRWPALMERAGATWTWVPNFAFALLNAHAGEVAARGFRLDRLRYALNGGEAVLAETARAWTAMLAPCGVRADAVLPAWGMAETASVALACAGYVAAAGAVPVGTPLPDFRLRIVGEDGTVCPEGVAGRLLVAGGTVTPGYYDDPAADAEAFTADGWLDTGDLAVLSSGAVTITGRRKAIVIVNGVNHGCHEIEAVVDAVDGVRPSFTAVAAVRGGGQASEGLAVFFVPASADDAALRQILEGVRAAVSARFGAVPVYLVPLEAGRVPKTSLGKVQRQRLADALAEGAFAAEVRRADRLVGGARTLPDWFFARRWRAAAAHAGAGSGLVLVYGHGEAIDEAVMAGLALGGQAAVQVMPGARFGQEAADRFVIDPDRHEDVARLFERLAAEGRAVGAVAYLLNYRAGGCGARGVTARGARREHPSFPRAGTGSARDWCGRALARGLGDRGAGARRG